MFTMIALPEIFFDYVFADDIPAALEIEQQGYPADEAATESSFRLRQSQAGDLFLGAYERNADQTSTSTSSPRKLIGYICATLSPATSLTHHSMSTHVPDSTSVCIHSVCVAPSHRRKGVGLALMKEYLARLEKANEERSQSAKYERVLLIVHEELREFYEKAGFEWMGRSDVVHGSKPWFEMRKVLSTSSPTDSPTREEAESPEQMLSGHQSIPPGVLEALHRPSNTSASSSKLISDFPNALSDVLDTTGKRAGVSVNKYDLLCPRSDCGSVILKKGVAAWVERASVQMEPPGYDKHNLPPLPTPPETAQWWLVTPSPMAFENIGFTRPVQPLTEAGGRLKLLTCAECDLGPLGWSQEGGSEFWLACSRVAYRA